MPNAPKFIKTIEDKLTIEKKAYSSGRRNLAIIICLKKTKEVLNNILKSVLNDFFRYNIKTL